MFWLGDDRGYLSDWVTQRWVQLTGRRVSLSAVPWLDGLVGSPGGVGPGFFDAVAAEQGLELRGGRASRGILGSFSALEGPDFDPSRVDRAVAEFYEQTSRFEMDAWAEWCGAFRPFGGLLARLFSRRLQQLNVPLSPLETSRGVKSEVLDLVDPETGQVRYTAWLRVLVATGNVLYAGSYSVCRLPGHSTPCVKVVFPLPNGNAIVIMKPEAHPDGSFSITSRGRGFGDPGFYFTVRAGKGEVWARYLRTMRERIHVYRAEGDAVRTDHVLTLWGATFLRLHYRMRRQSRVAA